MFSAREVHELSLSVLILQARGRDAKAPLEMNDLLSQSRVFWNASRRTPSMPFCCTVQILKEGLFYQLISNSSHDSIKSRELLTLSPQICSVVLFVILPCFLKHFVNATFFECILVMIRAG